MRVHAGEEGNIWSFLRPFANLQGEGTDEFMDGYPKLAEGPPSNEISRWATFLDHQSSALWWCY